MKRVLTALVLAPCIVYVVLWGHPLLFYAVLAAVSLICYSEYAGIARAQGSGAFGPLGYGAGLLLLMLPPAQEGALVVVVAALLGMALAMREPDLRRALPHAAMMVLGVVYIFGAFRCGALIRAENPHWLMFALLVSWIGDTGAYYVGRKWGRHKMAPRVSPAKSWEGSAASIATAMAAGAVYLHFCLPAVSLPLALALSAAVDIAGQIGDLAESAIKRGAGVKDSGRLLPGHGGLLDRVDSTLFALPTVWLALRFI
jgi:phosphatidate cytidylyltransferase